MCWQLSAFSGFGTENGKRGAELHTAPNRELSGRDRDACTGLRNEPASVRFGAEWSKHLELAVVLAGRLAWNRPDFRTGKSALPHKVQVLAQNCTTALTKRRSSRRLHMAMRGCQRCVVWCCVEQVVRVGSCPDHNHKPRRSPGSLHTPPHAAWNSATRWPGVARHNGPANVRFGAGLSEWLAMADVSGPVLRRPLLSTI